MYSRRLGEGGRLLGRGRFRGKDVCVIAQLVSLFYFILSYVIYVNFFL